MSTADVAILGATGHVGKALSVGLSARHRVTLYARRPEAARRFAEISIRADVNVQSLDVLGDRDHDVLVNCIGLGDPGAVARASLFDAVAEYADGLTLAYLESHPGARLVDLSSGAAYCSDFSEPVTGTEPSGPDCRFDGEDAYGRAKRASEARHRRRSDLAIVDLRLFSFFSRFMDPDASYLMGDVVRALLTGRTLLTGPNDIVRDYVAPGDLAVLVDACIVAEPQNRSLDVYSAQPVAKFRLLDAFVEAFGLTYSVQESRIPATGAGRRAYYSLDRRAESIGYAPSMTSLETLLEETRALVRMT